MSSKSQKVTLCYCKYCDYTRYLPTHYKLLNDEFTCKECKSYRDIWYNYTKQFDTAFNPPYYRKKLATAECNMCHNYISTKLKLSTVICLGCYYESLELYGFFNWEMGIEDYPDYSE